MNKFSNNAPKKLGDLIIPKYRNFVISVNLRTLKIFFMHYVILLKFLLYDF